MIRLGSYPPEATLAMPRPEVASATPLAPGLAGAGARAHQSAALGQRPEAWTAEISRLLAGSEPPTEASRVQAASLLFAAEAPPSRDLQRLRDALRRSHCLEMPR